MDLAKTNGNFRRTGRWGLNPFYFFHHASFSSLTPVIIDKYIPHDGIKPGPDIGSGLVVVPVGKSLIQGFLAKVPGRLLVAGEGNGKRPECLRIIQDQAVKLL